MANTTNLNLVKPAGTDYALVSVINGNMDIIDSKVGAIPANESAQSQITALNNHLSTLTSIGTFATLSALETALTAQISNMAVGEHRIVRTTVSAAFEPFTFRATGDLFFDIYKQSANRSGLNTTSTDLNRVSGFYASGSYSWYDQMTNALNKDTYGTNVSIGGVTKLTKATNWDTIPLGFYGFNLYESASGGRGYPSSDDLGLIMHIRAAENLYIQMCFGQYYYQQRSRSSSTGTWNAWRKTAAMS